jgi:hypothetical protein
VSVGPVGHLVALLCRIGADPRRAAILDRFSGVASLEEKIAQQGKVLDGMQRIMLDQQRDIAELKGMLRALVVIQGQKRRER